MPSNPRRLENKWIGEQPGGPELIQAIVDVNTMMRALAKRAREGDRIAGEKLGVAEVAMDRLEEIRSAMLKHRGTKNQQQQKS